MAESLATSNLYQYRIRCAGIAIPDYYGTTYIDFMGIVCSTKSTLTVQDVIEWGGYNG